MIDVIYGISTNAAIIIAILGMAYAVGITFLQRKITNAKRMRESQLKVKQLSKEMNDLVKAKANQELILAKQKEMMPLMSQSLSASIKSMIIIFPLFIAIYDYGIPALPFVQASPGGARWVFFISALCSGLLASLVAWLIDRKAIKKVEKINKVTEVES